MNNTNIMKDALAWWISPDIDFEAKCYLCIKYYGSVRLFDSDGVSRLKDDEILFIYEKEHPQPTSLFEQMAEIIKAENVSLDRDAELLKIARKYLMDVNFTALQVAHEAVKWQKEQSDKIIRNSLAVLKYVSDRIGESDQWWMDSPHRGGFDLEKIDNEIISIEKYLK